MADDLRTVYVNIEVPGRAVALALAAEMLAKAMRIEAEPQDDATWIFLVEARCADLVRQMLAKVQA